MKVRVQSVAAVQPAVDYSGPMIRITTQIYRGFAINIQQVDEASPPFWATIRRRFRQTHPGPRVFKGETEEGVVSQACAAVDRILA